MCVAKADKDTHDEEEHKVVKCDHCGFSDMKCRFNDHSSKCEKLPQDCKFCKQNVSHEQINDHYQICGSKTKKCEECGEYVKLVEMDMHKNEGFCDVMRESKKE